MDDTGVINGRQSVPGKPRARFSVAGENPGQCPAVRSGESPGSITAMKGRRLRRRRLTGLQLVLGGLIT